MSNLFWLYMAYFPYQSYGISRALFDRPFINSIMSQFVHHYHHACSSNTSGIDVLLSKQLYNLFRYMYTHNVNTICDYYYATHDSLPIVYNACQKLLCYGIHKWICIQQSYIRRFLAIKRCKRLRFQKNVLFELSYAPPKQIHHYIFPSFPGGCKYHELSFHFKTIGIQS